MKDFREKATHDHDLYNERKRYTEVQLAISSKLNDSREKKA